MSSTSHTKDLPIIVIGSTTTAMSVARIAAKSGYSVYSACEPYSCPRYSRYFTPICRRDKSEWFGQLGQEGHDALRNLALDEAILIPSADDAALWLSELPDDLCERFKVSISTPETMYRLQDKQAFSELVFNLDIPHPWTRFVETAEDLTGINYESGNSMFLKPTNSQDFVTKFGKKAIWISSSDEASDTCRSLAEDGIAFVVQEYVPGGSDDHYFIDGFRDKHGAVSTVTARRRIRIYPPDFGNSSYCVSVPITEVSGAWRDLQVLLDKEEYRGIFSAEFKQDQVDGKFKILEINTRPWVYIEFAYDCGLDMIDMYAKDAQSIPVSEVSTYDVGRGCVNLYGDIHSVLEINSSDRPGVLGLLRCWVTSSKLLFRLTDPLPALRFLARRTKSFIGNSFAKARN